jgi:helicase required for RNAi-mediated heterochromatin assembly 1
MLSKTGVGWRVEFSPQKQVKWKQSKRLLQGTMVALSSDMFKTECKIATVVGRGLSLLHQNPPAIELFWEDPEDAVIDQVQSEYHSSFGLVQSNNLPEYVMIEAREGYFEATRHMLVAMQKLMTEK